MEAFGSRLGVLEDVIFKLHLISQADNKRLDSANVEAESFNLRLMQVERKAEASDGTAVQKAIATVASTLEAHGRRLTELETEMKRVGTLHTDHRGTCGLGVDEPHERNALGGAIDSPFPIANATSVVDDNHVQPAALSCDNVASRLENIECKAKQQRDRTDGKPNDCHIAEEGNFVPDKQPAGSQSEASSRRESLWQYIEQLDLFTRKLTAQEIENLVHDGKPLPAPHTFNSVATSVIVGLLTLSSLIVPTYLEFMEANPSHTAREDQEAQLASDSTVQLPYFWLELKGPRNFNLSTLPLLAKVKEVSVGNGTSVTTRITSFFSGDCMFAKSLRGNQVDPKASFFCPSNDTDRMTISGTDVHDHWRVVTLLLKYVSDTRSALDLGIDLGIRLRADVCWQDLGVAFVGDPLDKSRALPHASCYTFNDMKSKGKLKFRYNDANMNRRWSPYGSRHFSWGAYDQTWIEEWFDAPPWSLIEAVFILHRRPVLHKVRYLTATDALAQVGGASGSLIAVFAVVIAMVRRMITIVKAGHNDKRP